MKNMFVLSVTVVSVTSSSGWVVFVHMDCLGLRCQVWGKLVTAVVECLFGGLLCAEHQRHTATFSFHRQTLHLLLSSSQKLFSTKLRSDWGRCGFWLSFYHLLGKYWLAFCCG